MRVHDILRKKGGTVVTLPSSGTLAELLAALDDNRIGSVVVVDDNQVVGIVSERDVIHHLRAGLPEASVVSDLMTEVHSVTAAADVDELAALMTERRQRHVPVVDEGSITGIVSIGDVVKARLTAMSAERDAMEDYLRRS